MNKLEFKKNRGNESIHNSEFAVDLRSHDQWRQCSYDTDIVYNHVRLSFASGVPYVNVINVTTSIDLLHNPTMHQSHIQQYIIL